MINTILWDVDGTLLDFLAAEKYGMETCLDEIGVKLGESYALDFARKKGLDILIYGHTHVPLEKTVPNGDSYVYLFNPGSLKDGSFGLIQVKNGRVLMSHGNLFGKK